VVASLRNDGRGPEALPVQVGGLSKAELLSRLHAADVLLNEAARTLFAEPRFTTAAHSAVVQTVQLSVAALGLPEGGRFSDLVDRARTEGLETCPLELGPHLRLQFMDQAEGAAGQPATRGCAPPGSVTVVSEPVCESDETPKGFYLRRIDGRLWLRGYRSGPGHVWSPQDVVVFVRRRVGG
jgi:hypothetical protein